MANVKQPSKTTAKSSAAKKDALIAKSVSGFVKQGNLSQCIAEKAYELYLKRGGAHGNDLGDWLAAEKIIMSQTK